MANNPYVNKVVKADGTTIIDISDTTATASDVASGKYFYTAAGAKVEGTASAGGAVVVWDEADSHGGTIRHIDATVISGTKSITANGTGIDVAEYAAVDVAVPQLDTSDANATASDIRSGKSGYVNGSKVSGSLTSRDSTSLSASGDTVTVPAGIYDTQAAKAVSAGTAGTPTATKGTVSNHSVSVTPSVTNTTGYITGSTKTGTAVSVSASELVSGSETKTANGTYDVTNLASLVVNVSGGSASFGTVTTTNSSNQNTTISFTLPSGRTPKAFFVRLTSQIARNSNSRYYYVFDMRWDGSSSGGVAGNTFYMYSGTLTDVTSGYSYSQDGTTFTLSSTGTRSASPGSFFNGTYEMVYVY